MKIYSYLSMFGLGASSSYRLVLIPSALQITSFLIAGSTAEMTIESVPETVHFKASDPVVELIAEDEEPEGDSTRTRVLTGENDSTAEDVKFNGSTVGTVTFHTDCRTPGKICHQVTMSGSRVFQRVSSIFVGDSQVVTNAQEIEGCFDYQADAAGKVSVKASILFCASSAAATCGRTANSAETQITMYKKCDGGGGGDPHFSTWDGTPYSYHGACDLVFAQSPTFADGLGLDIHVRTQIQRTFSRISNVAVKMGEDVLEVLVDGSHNYNGRAGTVADAPIALGNFPVRATHTCRKKDPSTASGGCAKFFVQYDIHLEGEDEAISITTFNGFLNVAVRSPLMNFRGLMGTYGRAGMFDRDGNALTDPIAMGSAWQVRDTEPMLFHNVEGPQYPEPCFLPAANARLSLAHTKRFHEKAMTAEGRRALRGGRDIEDPLQAEARAACNGANSFEGCVMDILTTRDLDMALLYVSSGNA